MSLFKKNKREEGNSSGFAADSQDVPTQLKKISDHLMFLEKKLDMILDNSRNRKPFTPGFGGNSYSGNRDPRDHYRSGQRRGYSSRYSGGQNRHGGNSGPRPNRPPHSNPNAAPQNKPASQPNEA